MGLGKLLHVNQLGFRCDLVALVCQALLACIQCLAHPSNISWHWRCWSVLNLSLQFVSLWSLASVSGSISQGKLTRGSQPQLRYMLFLSVNVQCLELSFVNCIATH